MNVKDSFDRGPEGWCSYDYQASAPSGHNIFIQATWVRAGGVNDSGHVWADDSRWSIDTPEEPQSILPFLFYRNWRNQDLIDLTEAEVSVYLRGDDLQLYGAECFFWVHGGDTRRHLVGNPLDISDGVWSSHPNRFTLTSDARWHLSWHSSQVEPKPLDRLLAEAESYGFSFVGFSEQVEGRLCMDEFEITTRR